MQDRKKERKIFFAKVILVILLILLISLIYCQISLNKIITEFYLTGENEIVLEYGQEYIEYGFTAISGGEDVSDKVIVTSNINEDKIGQYTVEYNLKLKYLDIDKILTRNVTIQDTEKPVLTIDSEKQISLYINDTYYFPTYSATDNYDGDITDKVEVDSNIDLSKEGTYEIKYSVKDSSNNVSTDTIVVNVSEKKKNAYIDISISQQKLRYYEYGELVLESDVVTGQDNATPVGTFYVLNKARNINLVGADYVSFVNYWIAFKGSSYGLHDASWRSSFGGTIYKYNGSHGCVNMPYYKVQQLYNMVEIGTPVYIKN